MRHVMIGPRVDQDGKIRYNSHHLLHQHGILALCLMPREWLDQALGVFGARDFLASCGRQWW